MQTRGYKENILAPLTDKFWLQEQISEKQFLHTANTFDLLLFKTNRFASECLQMFTDSEFDHAAMILKFEGDNPD